MNHFQNMKSPKTHFHVIRENILVVLCLLLATAGFAAEGADAGGDARLREALRNAMLQLRASETEKANLQAAQTAVAEEKKALNEKFETLRKQAVADRAATDKAIADLKAQLATQAAETASVKQSAEKWEALQKQSATLASNRETDLTRLTTQIAALERKVTDRETKNVALFQTANEILTRYEKFSLGEALAAREPFVGAKRAQLETLVQDYQDKLSDNRVRQK